jgi:mono/diheme cytochrome c family protein
MPFCFKPLCGACALSCNSKRRTVYAALMMIGLGVAGAAGLVRLAAAEGRLSSEGPMIKPNAAGMKIYKEANCVGCHKWHGDGGGGYGGAALSLRATALTKEQIMEVVRCGRPNTGMPYFDRDAYAADGCYGVTRETLGESMPMAGPRFLRPREIEAVVDYVLAEIKGKGEPNYADCTAFFGDSSRMCQHYRPAGAAEPATDAAGRPISR